jgi:hypothetical protein
MTFRLLRPVLGICCLLLLWQSFVLPPTHAAAPPASGDAKPSSLSDRAEVVKLARLIDRHINDGLRANKAVVAPIAPDSEFVRRVYLDIAGRIPRVSEVREFLADKAADKRLKLVEKLLSGPNYVNHLTNVWRVLLLPDNNNQQIQFLSPQIEGWLRPRLRDNLPYDKMVRELITADLGAGASRAMRFGGGDNGAMAFFQANEAKAENLAASTSRLFLGIKMECAQCHDHPFAKWTRKQFWEYTAFFAGIRPQNEQAGVFGGILDDPKIREVPMPNSAKKIPARFLDETEPKWAAESKSREVLADWMTAPSNPFFAKAAANRLWEHFFGIGLVDPVDDFREENPASHPALIDDLAKGFIARNFDLKFLIKAITASEAYNRSSELNHRSQENVRLYARMTMKGLSPEQVFDSLALATGYRGDLTGTRFVGFRGANTPRGEILAKFANPVDRRTESQTSILQALALMNGRFVADATSLNRSELLAAVADSPFMDTREKLDALYMAALSRPMRGSEAGRLIGYVNEGGPSKDSKKALADVFWVLLNSSEFILNH